MPDRKFVDEPVDGFPVAFTPRFAEWCNSKVGYLFPEEAEIIACLPQLAKEPLQFSVQSGAWREYRFRYVVAWENCILAICSSKKTADEVKQLLAPTYGTITKEVIAIETAKA